MPIPLSQINEVKFSRLGVYIPMLQTTKSILRCVRRLKFNLTKTKQRAIQKMLSGETKVNGVRFWQPISLGGCNPMHLVYGMIKSPHHDL